MGSGVGCGDGTRVGLDVGTGVGLREGEEVGGVVGTAVGVSDGSEVGCLCLQIKHEESQYPLNVQFGQKVLLQWSIAVSARASAQKGALSSHNSVGADDGRGVGLKVREGAGVRVGASEGDTESVGEGIGTTVGIEDGTMVGTEVACAIDPKHAAMSTRPAVRIIFAATQSVPESSVLNRRGDKPTREKGRNNVSFESEA